MLCCASVSVRCASVFACLSVFACPLLSSVIAFVAFLHRTRGARARAHVCRGC